MVRTTAACRNAISDLSVFGTVENCVRAVPMRKGRGLRRKEILRVMLSYRKRILEVRTFAVEKFGSA